MANIHKDVQAMLEHNPDAIECGACNLLYVPEIEDGIFIVHVMRLKDEPSGLEGTPVCPDCLKAFQKSGQARRDAIIVH